MDFALKSLDVFPAGTTVGAYEQSGWTVATLPPRGAPPVAALESQAMAAAGAIFTTLPEGDYFFGADVGGTWRWINGAVRIPRATRLGGQQIRDDDVADDAAIDVAKVDLTNASLTVAGTGSLPTPSAANIGWTAFVTGVNGGTYYRSNGVGWIKLARGLTEQLGTGDLSFDVATQAELDAHVAAGDPHPGYALDADVTAEATARAAADALKLAKASNLSDLADAATARTNLGLGSAATHAHGDYDAAGAAAAAQAASQPLDSDLTAIAALAPADDSAIQRKSGVWVARSMAQIKTDLALAKGDVGLGSVDNTSDAGKPVSAAQQTALDLKLDASQKGAASGVMALDASSRGAQAPKLHHADHEPGGADAMAVDAAAGTGSLRTIGKTALKAADGADTEYAFSTWKTLAELGYGIVTSGLASGTWLFYGGGIVAVNAANTGIAALYLDPADFAGSRTAKVRVRGMTVTNAVAPGITFTFGLHAITGWGGASNVQPTITSVNGTPLVSVARATPSASSQYHDESAEATLTAGWYALCIVLSANNATNSISHVRIVLQHRAT